MILKISIKYNKGKFSTLNGHCLAALASARVFQYVSISSLFLTIFSQGNFTMER